MKTTKRPVRLTTKMLQSIVEAEVKNVGFDPGGGSVEDEKDSKEVDADEFGEDSNSEHHIDFEKANKLSPKTEGATLDEHIAYMKALKIEESRLVRRLNQVKGALHRGAKKLVVARVV